MLCQLEADQLASPQADSATLNVDCHFGPSQVTIPILMTVTRSSSSSSNPIM
ncbi:hypothetical protein PanWU01x14_357090, partial [Parasponia andersonii]